MKQQQKFSPALLRNSDQLSVPHPGFEIVNAVPDPVECNAPLLYSTDTEETTETEQDHIFRQFIKDRIPSFKASPELAQRIRNLIDTSDKP